MKILFRGATGSNGRDLRFTRLLSLDALHETLASDPERTLVGVCALESVERIRSAQTDPVDLDDFAGITVTHWVFLEKHEVRAWLLHFADYKRVSLLPQMG